MKYLAKFISLVFAVAVLCPFAGAQNHGQTTAPVQNNSWVQPAVSVQKVQGVTTNVKENLNPDIPQQPQRKWVMLLYSNLTDLQSATKAHLKEINALKSNKDFTVVAEILEKGQKGYSTGRYYLGQRGLVQAQRHQKDMGDYRTVSDFVVWAKKHFPAAHYLLIIDAHGSGHLDYDMPGASRRASTRNAAATYSAQEFSQLGSGSLGGTTQEIGYSRDPRSKNFIRAEQTGKMLQRAGGVDVFVFYSCMMQTLELLYTVGNGAGYIVGSQEKMGSASMNYYTLGRGLTDNPNTYPDDLSLQVLKTSLAKPGGDLTLSAVNVSKIPKLVLALDKWARYMMSLPKDISEPVLSAALASAYRITMFDEKEDPDNTASILADLGNFVTLTMRHEMTTPQMKEAGRAVLSALNEAVLLRAVKGEGRSGHHITPLGISIGLPNFTDPQKAGLIYPLETPYKNLRFVKDSSWLQFTQWMEKLLKDFNWVSN